MDIAIVTGAETPLGLRIVQSLVQQGFRVHGIGNNFSKVTYGDPQFKGYAIDLTDLAAVDTVLEEIIQKEGRLHLLIHAIDVTPGTPFDKLPRQFGGDSPYRSSWAGHDDATGIAKLVALQGATHQYYHFEQAWSCRQCGECFDRERSSRDEQGTLRPRP